MTTTVPLPKPDPFWLARWETIINSIDETIQLYEAVPEDSRIGKLRNTLADLKEFGNNQFLYFFLGFSHEWRDIVQTERANQPTRDLWEVISDSWKKAVDNTYVHPIKESNPLKDILLTYWENDKAPQKLARDFDTPPDYVLRTIIDQATTDYEIIQRAIHQAAHGTANQKRTLAAADHWAAKILADFEQDLAPADSGTKICLPPDTTIIAYFNRKPTVRVNPYQKIALIGIPLTTTEEGKQRDLIVILHELGHYIFWHGRIGDKRVRDVMHELTRDQLPFIRNWIEELFADNFATMACPEELYAALIYWVIGMIKDNSPRNYWQNSNVHPIDAVRIITYLDNMRDQLTVSNGQRAEDVIKSLEFAADGANSFKTKDGSNQEIEISISKLQDMLQKMAQRIYQKVGHPLPFAPRIYFTGESVMNPTDAVYINRQEGLSAILQAFTPPTFSPSTRSLVESVNTTPNPFGVFDNLLNGGEDGAHGRLDDGEQCTWPEQAPFELVRETDFGPDPLPKQIWQIVFAADGWGGGGGNETWPSMDWESDWSNNPLHQ